MFDRLESLRLEAADAVNAAETLGTLEEARIKFLGKKGSITGALSSLKDMSHEERKEFGRQVNELKNQVEAAIRDKKSLLEQNALAAELNSAERVDFTLPVCNPHSTGSLHPVTLVSREIEEIFKSMGFMIEDGAEVETEFNNFEGVNIPKHHPARDMQDTYFLDNGQLLRTHTSAAQNRCLKKYGAPLKVILPGRCFRNEATDASHENTFFQCEGMMVGESVSISNLIFFMKTLLTEVFHRDIKVRLRPGFFPFVEPGFELDINCLICGGSGCPTCRHGGWVELLPCGMIHPNVLTLGGVDPEKYTGFAFGLGLTRLTMLKYGIHEIRLLNSGNLKVLRQFSTGAGLY